MVSLNYSQFFYNRDVGGTSGYAINKILYSLKNLYSRRCKKLGLDYKNARTHLRLQLAKFLTDTISLAIVGGAYSLAI